MFKRTLYSLAICFLFSFMGCQSNDLKSDLSLDEVIQRWYHATDPNDVLKHCKGFMFQQEATIKDQYGYDVKVVSVVYYKAPSTFKIVQFKNGKIFRKLYLLGEKSYSFNPKTQKLVELKGRSADLVRIYTSVGNPHIDIRKLFKKITVSLVQEKMKENARAAKFYYKLVCDTGISDVPGYTLYIDRDTFLTYKMVSIKNGPHGRFKYVSFIRKYGVLSNGVKYALETDNMVGETHNIFTITNYVINPKFRKDEFKLPEPWFDQKK